MLNPRLALLKDWPLRMPRAPLDRVAPAAASPGTRCLRLAPVDDAASISGAPERIVQTLQVTSWPNA